MRMLTTLICVASFKNAIHFRRIFSDFCCVILRRLMRSQIPEMSTPLSRWDFRPTRRSVVRLGVMLAAAMLLNANSREARATCGDYLMMNGSHAKSMHVEMAADGVPMPVQHRPCHGPGCRQAPPSAPLPPAPVELTFRHDL